jgi:translation initiation factor 3 subunit G
MPLRETDSIHVNEQSAESETSEQQTLKASLSKAGAGKVACRICKGDHFTAKCPYKDSLAGLESIGASRDYHAGEFDLTI